MTKNNKKVVKSIVWILFLIYIIVLVYFLFFSERYGRIVGNTYKYNLIPFSEIRRYFSYYYVIGMEGFLINIVGNILAFVPFGLFLPIIRSYYKKFLRIVLDGFIFTISVETVQLLLKVGCFDVDDMILNTLGVILGYVIYMILKSINNRMMQSEYIKKMFRVVCKEKKI